MWSCFFVFNFKCSNNLDYIISRNITPHINFIILKAILTHFLPMSTCVTISLNLIFKKWGIMGNFSHVAPMSLQTLGAYLSLYLKNWQEKSFGLQWVKCRLRALTHRSVSAIIFSRKSIGSCRQKCIPPPRTGHQ